MPLCIRREAGRERGKDSVQPLLSMEGVLPGRVAATRGELGDIVTVCLLLFVELLLTDACDVP